MTGELFLATRLYEPRLESEVPVQPCRIPFGNTLVKGAIEGAQSGGILGVLAGGVQAGATGIAVA